MCHAVKIVKHNGSTWAINLQTTKLKVYVSNAEKTLEECFWNSLS